MPTTFNVISLGVQADMDQFEGGNLADNAAALVGLTFGGVGDALVNDFVEFSPGSTGFGGGTATAYDTDNNPAETFQIDGGPEQTFDSTAIFGATITFVDGSTATISAIIFQDTAGNTYLAPEFTANADQTTLESGAIRSITLNSLQGANFSGLTGNRQEWNFAVCFAEGTAIETLQGPKAVEGLAIGDAVMTKDKGPRAIRWIGRRTVAAVGAFAPVRIAKGALGTGLPKRDLVVSQQHRVLIVSKIAERIGGTREILVAAKKLVGRPGITLVEDLHEVTYHHILLDEHEIIFAEGAATESLLAGPMVLAAFNAETLAEIRALFPDFDRKASIPARQVATGKALKSLLARHEKHDRELVVSD